MHIPSVGTILKTLSLGSAAKVLLPKAPPIPGPSQGLNPGIADTAGGRGMKGKLLGMLEKAGVVAGFIPNPIAKVASLAVAVAAPLLEKHMDGNQQNPEAP